MISRRDLVWVPSLTVKKNEVKRMKKKIKAYKRRDNIAGYVMLAPWLFGFVLMYFLPMLISIISNILIRFSVTKIKNKNTMVKDT